MKSDSMLSPTKTSIIEAAAARPDGNIEPLPATLRGGARTKVIEGLINKGLAVRAGDSLLITDAGYAAIGVDRSTSEGTHSAGTPGVTPRAIRPGTKLAEIIDCLRQPGGATIAQMMATSQWQAHTIRGAISGMIKKKLGLNVESAKRPDGERVYRIV